MSAAGGLQALIERQRAESFRARSGVSDEKVLGVLIAKYARWDGAAIIEAAVAALVDANFHDEAARVQALLAGG
jgi:hypothetical protein